MILFSVRILAKTLQATTATETNWTYDQSWLAIMCTSPSILKRHVAIARLKNPCNLGRNCQEARFIVFILSPMREKGTKNFLETGRTFATIFADIELRAKLLKAATQEEFISIIDIHTDHLMEQQTAVRRCSLPDPFDDATANPDVSGREFFFQEKVTRSIDFSRRTKIKFTIVQSFRTSVWICRVVCHIISRIITTVRIICERHRSLRFVFSFSNASRLAETFIYRRFSLFCLSIAEHCFWRFEFKSNEQSNQCVMNVVIFCTNYKSIFRCTKSGCFSMSRWNFLFDFCWTTIDRCDDNSALNTLCQR